VSHKRKKAAVLRRKGAPLRGRLTGLILGGLCLLVGAAHAEPNKVLYELQERCGRQAADFFKAEFGGEHHVTTGKGTTLQDYENHYSPRLNKCFFLYRGNYISSKENFFKMLQLYELNEHKQYGAFSSGISSGMECEVLDHQCRGEQEWRELAKPFLED
jgi:hypothetical protein